jgi:hypothetical protein
VTRITVVTATICGLLRAPGLTAFGPTACVVPVLEKKTGAGDRIRTDDLLITNQLLYRLSYPGTPVGGSAC